ncbi:MAG: TRAP transporter TatT component family protein [Candidatus Neomarinimicrobiota bacterium]
MPEFKKNLALTIILLLAGCQFPATQEKFAAIQNSKFLESQGWKYWEKRHQENQARMAYTFFKRAAEVDFDNQELMVQYSRACYFIGHYIENDPALKDSLFREGLTAGKTALYLSPVFSAAFENANGDTNLREIAAISAAPPELIDALFWWSANLGRYMAYKPAISRIKYQEHIETTLHRILALKPDYYYGAAYRFFGALYARIPGIELSRSKDYFDLAVAKHPEYLGTYTLRAEFYHTKAGNREQFHRDLVKVIESNPTVLPDVMAENMFEQEYARRLLEREHLLFE